MNSTQNAKLVMYNAVISFCDKNMIIINSIPALLQSYTSFKDTIVLITGTTQKKAEVLTGIAKGKTKKRTILARAAAALAAKIYAYANAAGLDKLKESVNFSVSYLERLKDLELPAVCKNILKAAMENVAMLTKYNVTVQTNTAFSDMITAYVSIEPDPRNARSALVMHNVSLKTLIKRADNFLKGEIDKIIASCIDTYPDFFTNYMSNRVIIDAATTSTQIKGKVTDRSSGNPLEDAKVDIPEAGITVMTNSKGKFVIKLPVPDKYTVIISKEGYNTLTFADMIVKLGQITPVIAALEMQI